MSLVNRGSLAVTLANLNLALLKGEKLTQAQRDEIADWIASRVGVRGSYRGRLPAPTERDYQNKLHLFTGETFFSRAGTSCKLGFEATWALTALRPRHAAAVAAAESCREFAVGLFAREKARQRGMYCCYSCSTAGWRALGIAPPAESGKLLDAVMAVLRACRDGKGRWQKFPFWYALLALHDLDQPRAQEELHYAVPALERALSGRHKRDLYARRRRLLAERILQRA